MSHDLQLENANRQVAEYERMVAGWSDLIGRMRTEGRDVTVSCQILEAFKASLVAHRSNRDMIQHMIFSQSP